MAAWSPSASRAQERINSLSTRPRSLWGLTLQPLAPASWTREESWANDPSWSAYDKWALQRAEREAARDSMQLDDLKNRIAYLPHPATFTFDFEFADSDTARQADRALALAGYAVHDLIGDADGDGY